MPKNGDFKKLFKQLIDIIHSKAAYGNILLIDRSALSIINDFDTVDISNSGEMGVKIRAFDGEKWFETFSTNLSPENLVKITKDLVKDISIKPNGIKFDDEKIGKTFSQKPKINPAKVSLEKKIQVVNKIINYLKNQKHLKNGRSMYDEGTERNIFCSKNKYLVQDLYKISIISFAMVEDEQKQIRYAYAMRLKPGFEVSKDALLIAKLSSDEAKKVAKAKKITPGKYRCITGPEITGLLAHESFGHGMESDTVYKDRAQAKEWVGKKIASNFVNILDDPSMKDKHGSFFFDHEGQITKPTYLIKNGVVKDYITEMLSAKKMKAKRSGNGRCESFDHKVYARMSNTFFGKGKDNLKNMFKNIKDGIFLSGRGGGMEDPKGWGVQIQGIFAQRIKNGKLVDEYYDDVGITGCLLDILGNIKQVSTDFSIKDMGHCGKGHKEWVEVSTGGSYLRIEKLDLA